MRQLDLARRGFEGDRHEGHIARLDHFSIDFFARYRLRDAVAKSIKPTIVRGLGNAFLQAEVVDAQATCLLVLQSLLPFQIIVQVAGWSSHRVSPHECQADALKIGRLTSTRSAGPL